MYTVMYIFDATVAADNRGARMGPRVRGKKSAVAPRSGSLVVGSYSQQR
jgi:hypothetical protein